MSDTGTIIQMSKRLDRIEEILEKVRDALERIARTEEKLSGVVNRVHDQDKEIVILKTSLTALQRERDRESVILHFAKKAIYVFILFLACYAGTNTEKSLEAVKVLFGGL